MVAAVSADSIAVRCTAWHATKFPGVAHTAITTKLAEEVGEVCRALGGELEGREGRGDTRQEAAQCVLVLASFIGRRYGADLLADVEIELRRQEAADAFMLAGLSYQGNLQAAREQIAGAT